MINESNLEIEKFSHLWRSFRIYGEVFAIYEYQGSQYNNIDS